MTDAGAEPTAAGELLRCAACGDLLPTGARRCPRDGTRSDERIDPFAGAILAGRYRLIARIGRGGMSSVYLARHVVIDRLSAVKILRSDLTQDSLQRDRFLREARAVNRLQHENVIEITDYGETPEGLVFLVMEYVPGDSLLSLVGRGPIDARRAIDIACQIAAALGRAHQMNVIHRDLKPDNVILTRREDGSDHVKLLDFGIAKVLDAPSLTINRRVFGTPGYIAPEYAIGGELTPQSDLYALGVVLYELVTCALPFEASHVGQLLMKHVTQAPTPPRAHNPAVPEELERVILRCLAKKPEDRHRDAYHLLDDLRAVRAALDLASADAPSVVVDLSGTPSGVHIHGVANFRREETPTRIHRALLAEGGTLRNLASAVSFSPLEETPTARETAIQGRVLGLAWPSPHDLLNLPGTWSDFLAALRTRAEESLWTPPSSEARELLDALEVHVGTMREASEAIHATRERTLALEASGREFRESIGRAIDTLASDLSQRQRERQAALDRRAAVELRLKDAALPQGERAALHAELTASEAPLNAAVVAVPDIEFQLRALSTRIDQLNENLETDRSELMATLNRHLDALRSADVAARHLAVGLERTLNPDTRRNH